MTCSGISYAVLQILSPDWQTVDEICEKTPSSVFGWQVLGALSNLVRRGIIEREHPKFNKKGLMKNYSGCQRYRLVKVTKMDKTSNPCYTECDDCQREECASADKCLRELQEKIKLVEAYRKSLLPLWIRCIEKNEFTSLVKCKLCKQHQGILTICGVPVVKCELSKADEV